MSTKMKVFYPKVVSCSRSVLCPQANFTYKDGCLNHEVVTFGKALSNHYLDLKVSLTAFYVDTNNGFCYLEKMDLTPTLFRVK